MKFKKRTPKGRSDYEPVLGGCFDCGHEVSNFAKTCPNCGRERPFLTPEERIEGTINLTRCHDCNHFISKRAKLCPSCGRPNPSLTLGEEVVELARMASANRTVIGCAILVLGVIGFTIYKIVTLIQ